MLIRTLLMFVPLTAQAQSYLPEPTLAAAQSRSQTQCAALSCDGVFTQFWWAIQPLNDGTAALVIQPGTPFDVTTTNKKAVSPVGLTAQEQAALETAAQIAPFLPVVTQLVGQGALKAQ